MLKSICRLLVLLSAFVIYGCTKQSPPDEALIEEAILNILNDQVRAWNEFNIERFMEGYLKSDALRFASGGSVQYGWQTTLERYKNRYPEPEAMGKLTFSQLSITIISDDAAVVFGRYTLERKSDKPTGLFTLLFRKTETGWKIVHDHTSSAQE